MTTIGSKSRSNKDKPVDSEKSEARTTTMESWADAMQNQDGWRKEKEELEEELSKSKRENDEVVEKLEEAWKAAEEETIEELERALLKERKTSEKWRNQLEHDEGSCKEIAVKKF
ncbi:hypothetical protein L3Y34_013774 [Caenorhabditis briggsae]|uniref:Uncharacterized protein n=1 Tax=Caenorhabditis briggsae TaxID=6238 RepID=A0AAE8ZZ91_CAEBR|nr:hypothetical protein L3Y34_013774 [Caenorhabditis briggsae]